MKIVLDYRKSVEQNAQTYFEKAKLSRKKMEGAKKALVVSLKKLEDETADREEKIKRIKESNVKKEQEKQIKREWYDNFRWFFSSEGFLVVGGRDATTNEIIIKKHTDKSDVVFHTDMAGSPFFVVKTGGKKPGEQTMQEVADATLCFSRAWKMCLATTPTFWVMPDQVSKEANQGEYLSKGAFMIRGKTNYMTPLPNCAVGLLEDGRVMCAPLSAVRKNCRKYVNLKQGREKPSEIAKIIRKKLDASVDDLIRVLPSGGIDIKE